MSVPIGRAVSHLNLEKGQPIAHKIKHVFSQARPCESCEESCNAFRTGSLYHIIYVCTPSNIAPEDRPSKRKLIFQPSIFRCYVSFREGITYICACEDGHANVFQMNSNKTTTFATCGVKCSPPVPEESTTETATVGFAGPRAWPPPVGLSSTPGLLTFVSSADLGDVTATWCLLIEKIHRYYSIISQIRPFQKRKMSQRALERIRNIEMSCRHQCVAVVSLGPLRWKELLLHASAYQPISMDQRLQICGQASL